MGKKINIDTDMLLDALEDHSFDKSYFLDVETGQIEILFSDDFGVQEDEVLQKRIENEGKRYWRIDPLEPQESFSIMDTFISTLDDKKTTEALLRALSGRKPFRHFKDTLTHYPEIREQWFTFKQEELKRLALINLALKIEELEKSGIEVAFLPLPGETG